MCRGVRGIGCRGSREIGWRATRGIVRRGARGIGCRGAREIGWRAREGLGVERGVRLCLMGVEGLGVDVKYRLSVHCKIR